MKARRRVYTLAFLKRGDDVLLGLKTRGLGAGLWNGFGGKVETNETLSQAAEREIREECGVEVDDLRHIGFMRYEVDGDPEIAIVHIFTATQIRGSPEPSEEMNPVRWYHRRELRNMKMYPDFIEWQRHVFEDKFFCGFVQYDAERRIIQKHVQVYQHLYEVLDCLD